MTSMTRCLSRMAAAIFLIFAAATAASANEGPESASSNGFERKAPVVAAACSTCPWGAVADVLKEIMHPRGYDLQICYQCSRTDNAKLVASAGMPPNEKRDEPHYLNMPPPPAYPVDFGVTQLHLLSQAYNGKQAFANVAPMRNLRAIGVIEHPMFVLVAARQGSFVTDLSQIRERRLPVRIMAENNPFTAAVLTHYGISPGELAKWGGSVVSPKYAAGSEVDVIIHNQTYLANTPEAKLWYDFSQQEDLRYLSLDTALLDKMQRDFQLTRMPVPAGLLRGLDRPIDTVARSGQVVYGRDDMPEDFAYLLAKAMDEESPRFIWTIMSLSYNPRTAPRALDVPLHPGAARYYRERGYHP